MKRARYLTGAVGIAPLAVGVLAAGAGQAVAEVTTHGKTVSLQAASGQRPRTNPPSGFGVHPDINGVNCGGYSPPFVSVVHGYGLSQRNCYANAGATDPNLHNVWDMWTGNNGMSAHLTEGGHTYYCVEVYKKTAISASQCTSTHNGHPGDGYPTMTYLRIFTGINR